MKKLIAFITSLVSTRHGGSAAGSASFLAALVVTLIGAGVWIKGRFAGSDPSGATTESGAPFYLPLAGSFAGGFVLGRLVRKFVKTAALVTAVAVIGIGLAVHFMRDDAGIAKTIKSEAGWVKEKSEMAKDYLLGLLPSAGGGAAGVFVGARKGKPSARQLNAPSASGF